jgi:hypothetical protein
VATLDHTAPVRPPNPPRRHPHRLPARLPSQTRLKNRGVRRSHEMFLGRIRAARRRVSR